VGLCNILLISIDLVAETEKKVWGCHNQNKLKYNKPKG